MLLWRLYAPTVDIIFKCSLISLSLNDLGHTRTRIGEHLEQQSESTWYDVL